ncbi:MAG: hypothetical protein V5A58_11025 [Salinibacter sp.]
MASLYQMERAFPGGSVSASPQGLSVDSGDLPVGLFFDSARPGPKAPLKLRRFDLAEHPGQRVMGRHSVFEREQSPKSAKLRFAKLGDGHKIVSAADCTTNRKEKDLLNRI